MAKVGLGFGLAAVGAILVLLISRRSPGRRTAPDGQPERMAAAMQTMRADREVRDAILASLEDGILLFGQGGNLVYRNPTAEHLLGGPVEDARAIPPVELRTIVDRALETGTGGSAEFHVGPTPRTLRVTAAPIADGHVLVLIRDITEARMVDAIRRDFVGNASHELKTPVASIRALAETIAGASAVDPASIPGFARQLEGEAVRLSKVVSDLLDLSRLEGGPSDYGQIHLDQLAREEADRLKTSSREAGLTLVVTADAPVTVTGSARDLGLLIRNLVENAIQYTRPGGRIDVSVLGDGREAALIVADTGIGIPSRERDRVFERFYRVDRARSRDTGGTGLGLSIVKHVAENHGGTVTVSSQLGKGSTFTIKLPATGPGAEL